LSQADLKKFKFSEEIQAVINNCKSVTVPKSRADIVAITLGAPGADKFMVSYDVDGKNYDEVSIVNCKNGVAVDY